MSLYLLSMPAEEGQWSPWQRGLKMNSICSKKDGKGRSTGETKLTVSRELVKLRDGYMEGHYTILFTVLYV